MDRRNKIILGALLKANQPITARELAGQAGCSERSIRNYMKSLQQELVPYNAGILSAPHRGYELSGGEGARLRLRASFLEESREGLALQEEGAFLLQELLGAMLAGRPVLQTELVERAFLSLSTLKQRLKILGRELASYGLKIASSRQGLFLAGDEAALRSCLFDALRNGASRKPLEQKIFSSLSLERLEQVVNPVLRRYSLKLTDEAVHDFYLYLAIAQQRSSGQQDIFYTVSQVRDLVDRVEYRIARDIVWELYEKYQVDLSANELFYLTQHLIASKKYFEESSKVSRQQVGAIVQAILKKIKADFDIDFSADDCLQDGLVLHLQVALSRMKFRMRVKNELLENIKTEYPMAFRLAIAACSVIERREHIAPDEDEIGYIAIHFGAALSRKGIQQAGKQKRVVIACASGMGAALLLRSKLEERFRSRIRIVQILPGYDIDEKLLEQTDYVLTTEPLVHIRSRKVLCIHPLCTEEDMDRIEEAIFQKDVVEAMHLDSLFQPAFFFVRNLGTKEEVLDFLTKKLLADGYMTEKTRESVFQREKISSTEIGNLVALPHPLVNDQRKSVIAVLILQKPIQWDANRVQIVFLISIEKQLLGVWNTIAVKLYDYLVKKNGVKTLLKEASFGGFFDDFVKMFK